MPAMTGLQLAQYIQEHFSGLPIILATGYAELPAGPSLREIQRLAKPCTQLEIAAAIHRAVRPPVAAEPRIFASAAS